MLTLLDPLWWSTTKREAQPRIRASLTCSPFNSDHHQSRHSEANLGSILQKIIKMKFLAVFAILVGACAAQRYSATQNANEIVITRSESENNGDGTFKWLSELSDGTRLEQNGYVKPGPDPESPIQVIQGAYSYTSPEGQQINLQYTADENGFVPQGDHLPTPPPIPEEIQKALDIIYRNADNAGASSQQQQQFQQRPQANRFQQQRRF